MGLMLTKNIKELAAARARAAALEKKIAAQLSRELAALPGDYGFDSVDAFVRAVKSAAKGGGRRAKASTKVKKAGKRFRAVITDATRSKVKDLVAAGKTGAEIAKSLKISLPSVQNIKKALGLVKARK
jgi:DNA-binding NarL/FixJ family response regulator